jgi:hypothetical protein
MLQEADWQSAQTQNLFHVEHNKQSKSFSSDINKGTKTQSQGDKKYTYHKHTPYAMVSTITSSMPPSQHYESRKN